MIEMIRLLLIRDVNPVLEKVKSLRPVKCPQVRVDYIYLVLQNFNIKGVLVDGFMRPQGQYKCSKMSRNDNKVHYRPNHQKNFRNFAFFRFFLRIFFKMKFKNNVCFNLTTKTPKYHLDVSQLSDQCFSSFLLSLLTKKRSIFFRKFSLGS